MKSLIYLTILFLPIAVFAYVSPGKANGYVNDFANILTVEQKQSLESKAVGLKQNSGFEVVTVTVKSLGGDTVENFATKLFAEWGIGNKQKDTGLLILVSMDEHAIRMETGYGTEGVVTDLQSGNIIRNVITPAFRDGNYFAGLDGAMNAVSSIITKSGDAEQYSRNNSNSGGQSGGSDFNFTGLFFFVIIILNFLAKILGKTKSWWLGGVIGAGIGCIIGLIWGFVYAGIGSIVILTILGLIFDFFVSKNGGKGSGPGGFWIFPGMGGGGSHFGGGGFGGFGGGGSGGGGASGRW